MCDSQCACHVVLLCCAVLQLHVLMSCFYDMCTETVSFDKGDYIIKQGDEGDKVWSTDRVEGRCVEDRCVRYGLDTDKDRRGDVLAEQPVHTCESRRMCSVVDGDDVMICVSCCDDMCTFQCCSGVLHHQWWCCGDTSAGRCRGGSGTDGIR